MTVRRLYLAALMALLAVLVACTLRASPTPSATQVPTSTRVSPGVTPTSQTPITPTISAEDAAWQKVVEAAKREGPLTIYSFNLTGDTGVNVGAAFTKKTGLELNVISGPTASMVERVKVERRVGAQAASIVTGSISSLLVAKEAGLTQKIGNLPELRKEGIAKYSPWADKDGQILVVNGSIYGPWINTTLVPPGAEPKSWRDFLKPEWKGKIAMLDPAFNPSPNVLYYGLISRGRLDTAYFSQLAKQNLQYYASGRMSGEALSQGRVSVDVAGAASSMGPFVQQGAKIKAIDMAEGVALVQAGSCLILVEGSPQPNSARVFINWLMSLEGQTVLHKNQGTFGFRKDVPNFEPPEAQYTPANPIIWGLEDWDKAAQIQTDSILKKLLAGQ